MKINLEEIKEMAKDITEPNELLLEIYRSIFPNFERIEKIEGWPSISRECWKKICEVFIQLNCPTSVTPALVWMNFGFSAVESLEDTEVDLSSCTVYYKGESPYRYGYGLVYQSLPRFAPAIRKYGYMAERDFHLWMMEGEVK